MRRKVILKALRAVLLVELLFLLFVGLQWIYPGMIWFFIGGAGHLRDPHCSTLQAVWASRIMKAEEAAVKKIAAETRRVAVDGDLELLQTPAGRYLVPGNTSESKASSGTLLAILLAQQQRGIYGDSEWGVRSGDTVLDAGAHVGVFTRKALDSGALLVVAIEPSPKAIRCLRQNFASEISAGRVIVYPKGVWNRDETLTFYLNTITGAGDSFLIAAGQPSTLQVPVVTVDTLVRELRLPRVDFIKADIKGAATRMVQGARETLTAYRPRLVFATEEVEDDPLLIEEAVHQACPGCYEMKCGPCRVGGWLWAIGGHREVDMETLFFRAVPGTWRAAQ